MRRISNAVMRPEMGNLEAENPAAPGRYAELHCLSNYSFLRGASHPEELVRQARALGYAALALTDECALTGVVRAHAEATRVGLPLIIGSEFTLEDGLRLVLLATDRPSYGRLCALITVARGNSPKGRYRLDRHHIEAHLPRGCLALWLPGPEADGCVPDREPLDWVARHFSGATWIAVELLLNGRDRERLRHLQTLGRASGIPLVACGDVHMHIPARRPVQDTLTAIRLGRPLAALGTRLHPNGERHLRPRHRLEGLYPPGLLEESLRIASRCRFSLDRLRYEYPTELTPPGHTPDSWLSHLVEAGLDRRWPEGPPQRVRAQVTHELALVRELAYAPYFLTVHDIVRFARSRGILCQGRGSAANSAICYCLGITEVDPARMNLLFERFISRERDEPPDIDVDFEHQRREEVIQYIYRKYGRERAALAATVITYRPRSAIRDVGKALGLEAGQIDRLARTARWWDGSELAPKRLREAGLDPDSPLLRRLSVLVDALIGFPRHLSQHVGGFVISQGPLSHLVPIENAAMAGRTVIQWEKEDLEALGLLKVDILALGMLSAIRRALGQIGEALGRPLPLGAIPAEDPAVYDMICRADTVGVFQIESRAQMSMLPRLRPRCYYDLVIQVAIVRPGPIQGEMVHPYLARRSGREPVHYPSEAVRRILERTLGVPIFQEQVMQLAMVAAGFSAGEADRLRRSMAAWGRRGGPARAAPQACAVTSGPLDGESAAPVRPPPGGQRGPADFEKRLLEGMRERGYPEQFARQIFNQIKGFGEYGFPESHAASFALLAYVSAWLKHHYPAFVTCALLNSQPMGFYAPAQLVQDARRHGVEVRPVDVRHSAPECTLEAGPTPTRPALRLGLNLVKGLSRSGARALVAARCDHPLVDLHDLAERSAISRTDLQALAGADALQGLEGHRHRAWWQAAGAEPPLPLFGSPVFAEAEPLLRGPTEGEDITADYTTLGLSLRRHPLALLRPRLAARGFRTARALVELSTGRAARAAGLVLIRQRPGSASGVIFATLEDETGTVNIVVWPRVAEAQRRPLLQSRLLGVSGTIQHESGVLHLIARRLEDLSPWLKALQEPVGFRRS